MVGCVVFWRRRGTPPRGGWRVGSRFCMGRIFLQPGVDGGSVRVFVWGEYSCSHVDLFIIDAD